MTRAPRHTTLADRAATTRPDRSTSGLRGLGDRGHLTVVGEMRLWDMCQTIRRIGQRAVDADGDGTWPAVGTRRAQMAADCRLLLTACGLIEDDGRDLP